MSSLAFWTDIILSGHREVPHSSTSHWLLHHKPTQPFHFPHQVITYFAGRVFDPNEAERGRVAFAGEYLKGDASLLISDLSLTDSGEYSCKVKTGAQYHWSTIRLIVLGKWQTAFVFNKKKQTDRGLMRTLYSWKCHESPKVLALELSLSASYCWRPKCVFERPMLFSVEHSSIYYIDHDRANCDEM